jgi:hypothetical protein
LQIDVYISISRILQIWKYFWILLCAWHSEWLKCI